MTYEQAEYFKLLLLSGYRDELDAFVEQALVEENPLSELILSLSADTDNKTTLSILNDFIRKKQDGDLNYTKVFEDILAFLRHQYWEGKLPIAEITDLMYRISTNSGQYTDSPWATMYYFGVCYSDVEIGYLDRNRFLCAFHAFLEDGSSLKTVPADKPSVLSRLKKRLRKFMCPRKTISLFVLFSILVSMAGCGRPLDPGTSENPTSTAASTWEDVTQATDESTTSSEETKPDEPPPELNFPYQDSDFVAVQDCLPQIWVDLKYATDDNFSEKTIYDFQNVYLRYGTIKKLNYICHALAKQGLFLKIWDGFRPVSAQSKLWAIYPNADYVVNPNTGVSAYSRGNTLAVTLVDSQGKEVQMPSKFDDFSSLADRDYSDCTPAAAKNAKLLQSVMEKYGFTGYATEWWHYTDTTEYPVETCFDPAVMSLWYADCNEYINLRTEPNSNSQAILQIPKNGQCTLLGWSGKFAFVEYQTRQGYVSAGYLQPVKEAIVWTPICNEYINMRKTPGGTTLVTQIPVNASVSLDKWYGKYALVTYNGKQGYVLSNYLKPMDMVAFANQLHVVTATTEYSYQNLLEDMEKLQAMYPHLVHTDVIGKSELGRDIPVLRIGNPQAEHHVLMQGAIHAREHFTAWLLTALADYSLSQNYFASGNVCYHIIPMSNPDGVIISQTQKLDSTQETIYRNDRAAGYTSNSKSKYAELWKSNALGVDLNRNFSSGWENSLERPVPSSEKFRGTAPFSAAESRALRDYTLKYDFDVTISVHSSGSVIYYQYGKKQPVNQLSLALAQSVEKETGYRKMSSDGTSGAGYKDWAMDELGIPSLTLEIGCYNSPLEERDIYNTFSRCQNLLPAINAWLLRENI